MTDAQLKALQSYVASVVRVMTNHSNAHAQNVRLLLDSRRALEQAFGQPLYPDLFGDVPVPQPKSDFPDLL